MKKRKSTSGNKIVGRKYADGRYAVLLVDGKIKERYKLKKSWTLNDAKAHFKHEHSLNPNRKVAFITRNDGGVTRETTDIKVRKKRFYKPAGKKYQYVISADVKNKAGKWVHVGVRSKQYNSEIPIRTAQQNCEEKFYRIISYHIYQDSRHGTDQGDLERNVKNYQEGIVYYNIAERQTQI